MSPRSISSLLGLVACSFSPAVDCSRTGVWFTKPNFSQPIQSQALSSLLELVVNGGPHPPSPPPPPPIHPDPPPPSLVTSLLHIELSVSLMVAQGRGQSTYGPSPPHKYSINTWAVRGCYSAAIHDPSRPISWKLRSFSPFMFGDFRGLCWFLLVIKFRCSTHRRSRAREPWPSRRRRGQASDLHSIASLWILNAAVDRTAPPLQLGKGGSTSEGSGGSGCMGGGGDGGVVLHWRWARAERREAL
jgi:hypothetical protein